MADQNTGYLITVDLIKVVDGGAFDGQALDDNNQLCSVSGLPQSQKQNLPSDPDYIPKEYNTTACPLVPPLVAVSRGYTSDPPTSCASFSEIKNFYSEYASPIVGEMVWQDLAGTTPASNLYMTKTAYPDSYDYMQTDGSGIVISINNISCL